MQKFADKVVENINVDEDYVWVHDYHLLALPSLLRKVPLCSPAALLDPAARDMWTVERSLSCICWAWQA